MPTPTPPVTPAAGQAVLWSTATVVNPGPSGPTNGSATGTLTTGAITFTASQPLGNWYWVVEWEGFNPVLLPAGWTIDAVYPVLIVSGSTAVSSSSAVAGPNINMYTVNSFLTGSPFTTLPSGGNFSGQYATDSLGNSNTDITGMKVGIRLFSTAPTTGFLDTLNISYAGLAVYITPKPTPTVSVSVGTTAR